MNTACVIGGSGFLGSHVADALSNAGYKVTIFDKKLSPWLRKDQNMILGDLLDFQGLNKAIMGSDFVYNFAGLADINKALDRPLETISLNIQGNTNVLEACRLNDVKRFCYASTVYVYGNYGGFYRCSKQAAEHYVEEYQKRYSLDYTILRYGSLYGPRSDDSNGLYRMVSNVISTRSLKYTGSPDTLREYIHVVDAARASVIALNPDFRNESLVLTGQEPMHVADLLKMIGEIIGIPGEIDFLDGSQPGHYIRTPYAYQPKLGRKYVLPMHVDLGQGLLELIHSIKNV